ncbi:aromatic amino acid ammonia-lyase [Streptomyces sp. NPDC093707]|uniref:aromatic amino acid ammonia-lyase n=1 Tax=Streptomyces sp. NPDC093707 TaxID=3154984 RepID=UPI00344F3371
MRVGHRPPSRRDPAPTAAGTIPLNGAGLGYADVVRLADGRARAVLDPVAVERMARCHATALRLVAIRRLYGRTTGVGANSGVSVTPQDAAEHGMRLLRSHACGAGRSVPAREVRAMLAVRTNQLLAGGSGINPQVAHALVAAVNSGAHPVVQEYGGVGTGDLAALAQTGLALAGEVPWEGTPSPAPLDSNDALSLISSNALALGRSALVLDDLRRLLRAAHAVAALCLLGVDASMEPYAEPVHHALPHPGSVRSAAHMRSLLGATQRAGPSTDRVQDPFAFRCLPQVYGAALEAADIMERVLDVELNAAAENPLISAEDQAAYHHGGFFAAQTALVLDHLRLAVCKVAQLSHALLGALCKPALTGLRPFLAVEGSSGVMVLGHTVADALSDLHNAAVPATLGHVVLCQGFEELASFASLAARQGLRTVESLRVVLACLLVAAVRALRQRGTPPAAGTPAARAFLLADEALDRRMEDRPLTGDVEVAVGLLDRLGEL